MASWIRRRRGNGAAPVTWAVAQAEALLECGACGTPFVTPIAWWPTPGLRWRLRLRCGECQRCRVVTVDDEVAQHFDRVLDRGVAEIEAAAARADQARFRAQVEALVTALRLDLIGADDFGG